MSVHSVKPLMSVMMIANLFLMSSCDGATKEEKTESGGGNETSDVELGGSLNLKFISDSQSDTSSLMALKSLLNPVHLLASETILGQSGVGKLKSAQFRVIDILLCGSTDESQGDACVGGPEFTLYSEGKTGESDYDSFLPEQALDFEGWTDFTDDESTAKLAKSIDYTKQNVAKYSKVVVHFYRAFKINAEVELNDGRTVYTKATEDFRSNNKSGLDVTFASATDDTLTGPSEDAVFFLPNGGKTFYLQSPFEISETDVQNKASFKMILAFDPDNLIKANAADAANAFEQQFLEGQIDTTNNLRITAPFIEFAPVVAKSTETIMRDTYLLDFGGDNPYQIRLGLYYVKEDSSKSVRAVTSNLVYTDETKSYMNFNPLAGIRGFVANDDGTYQIQQGAGKFVAIEKFERHGAEETGSGTQSICVGSFDPKTGCAVTPTTLDYVSTFIGSEEIDAPAEESDAPGEESESPAED